MRRWLALPVVTLAVLAARPVGAEDPKTYTIPTHETWKVGDIVSKKATEKKIEKQTVKGPDGTVLKDGTTEEVETYEGTMKVLEVNAEGEFSKAIVYFKSWSRTVGDKADDSLAGKHIEVSGTGAGRTAKVVTPGAEVSPEALKWLDDEFGAASAKKQKSGEVLAPKKPVAVGETVTIDSAELVKGLNNEQMKFLVDKSGGKFTLKDVQDGVATIEIAFDLQADGPDTPNGKMEWKEGGILTMHMEGTKALDAGVHVATGHMSGGLKGTLEVQGVTVVIDTAVEGESVVTAGGEMPEVPASK